MRVVPWAGVVAAIVLAWSSGADARVMLHHDLTSLALLSDAIVLAERGGTRELSGGLEVAEMRVRRVYAGLVATGSTFEVPDSSYALDGTPEAPLAGRSPEIVLFLVRSGRSSPRWWIVASGVRVQVGGRVFRFEARSDVGPYAPVPQGRDPLDVQAAIAPETPVDFATFEADLRAALARAENVRATLAPTPRTTRREPRLALLPPIQDRVAGPWRGVGAYRDEVARRVVGSFLADNDLDGAFEALARVIGDRPPVRGRSITSETLADAALAASRPPHLRIEALASVWDTGPASAAVVERLAPLLQDPLPDVRAAAINAIAAAARGSIRADVRAASRRLLFAAAAREAEPLVRVALMAAGLEGLDRRLRGPARAIVARRRGEELWVMAGWRGKPSLTLELAEVQAAGAACEEHDRSSWSAGGTVGLATRLRCADPSAPWSVTVTVRSGRAEGRQTLEVR